MPYRSAMFWIEILVLGLVLVVGMSAITSALDRPWENIARIVFAAAVFGGYATWYERRWGGRRS